MAESEFSFESDMADFIRENLRDNQRVRDKGTPDFSSRPIVSQTTTTFNETRLPLPAPFIPSGEVLGGGSDILHQWKTTRATDTTVDVRGGTLTSQSGFAQADVAPVEDLGVTSSGYVILTVTREESSRDVTAAAISYNVGELPESTYYEQYIPLAKITFADDAIVEIEQRRFEEINILEDLAVVNGEFMLADLLIASRNIYELPPS